MKRIKRAPHAAAARKLALVDWFHVAQEGRCYLGATEKCIARNRWMIRRVQPRGYDYRSPDRFAGAALTIEHILPGPYREGRGPHLLLMACHDCNKAKGCSLPDPAHVERALALGLEYVAIMDPPRQDYSAQGVADWRALMAGRLKAQAQRCRMLISAASIPNAPAR